MFYVRFLELLLHYVRFCRESGLREEDALFFVSLPDAFGRIRDGKSVSSAGHHIGGDVFYPPDTYALCAAVSGATSKSVSCGHPLPAWLFVAENRCPQPDTRCLRCRPGWCWMPAARGAVRGGFWRIPAVTAVLNGRPEDADLLVARDTFTCVKVSRAIAFPAAWCPVEDTDLPSRRVRH